jgi:hypothetical protein
MPVAARRERHEPLKPWSSLLQQEKIMSNRSKLRLSRLTLGLAIALAAAPAFAQQTSSALQGVVVGSDGNPVVGAEVIISHEPSGTVSRVTTDASGRYNARGLRVGGPYTVLVQKQGFQSKASENVQLQLAQTGNVSLELEPSMASLDAIQVTGTVQSDTFNPSRMGTGTSVSRETIDMLPSVGRNIQDYIRLDPRIAQTDKERGEISAGGQNTRFNNIRIDGVSTNDSFGLESNNLPTLRQPISIDAVEQIDISLANYDVAVGQYTGANVNAVTRSGTNTFSGSVYGLYRDGDWARTGAIPGSFFAPPDKEVTYGMTFGGPIVKDKLFFFLSYENFERTIGGPTTTPAGISAAQIAEAQAIARDVWGFDAGSFALPSALKVDIEDIMLKLDWNISDYHRAYLRYNRTEQTDPILRNIGARSLSLSSFWHSNIKSFESVVGQVFSDWTDTFSTEFKISRADQGSLWDNFANLPHIRICLNSTSCSGADTMFLGTEQFRHINILETEQFNAFGAANMFVGDHEIKFGFDYQSIDIFNLFGRDQFGVYDFVGLDAFRAGTPSFFSVRYPIDGNINSIAADWTLENLALFVQDTWSVNYNLTITAGVRVDMPMTDDRPPFSQGGLNAFGFRNDTTIDGNKLFQPRVGFNYTFDSEMPMQVRGGIGLFSGAAANVWLSNPFTNDGGMSLGVTQVNTGAGIVFSPDPFNQPGTRFTSPTPGGALDLVHPDLKQPAVWKANIAFETELPWNGVVAGAELLLTEVEEAIYYEHLNLGTPNQVLPDGRMGYWTTALAQPGGWTGSNAQIRANRNRAYTDVLLARPTNKGNGQQLTLSLSQPMHENWNWMLAYTFTSATEVNPLTSSQAASNWGNSFVYNVNENVANTSNYEVRDRFTASLGYHRNFFDGLRSSVAMFYEGRSGRPFSYTFINDANGDGRVNDLLYVPSGPGDVIFTGGPAMEQAYFDYMRRNPGLLRWAGNVAEVNAERAPWVHTVDLRFSQELPGFWGEHKAEIWLDIINVGNLINKDWGRTEEVGFPHGLGIVRFEGIDPATGRYRYNFNEANVRDLTLRDNRGESRWAAQLGFRYRF